VQDGSERPFVVSVTEIKEDQANAYQPVVRVVTEGYKVVVRPVLSDDQKSVKLTCSLQHTNIEKVDEFSFKQPGKAKGEIITVQVPAVKSQVLKINQQDLACGSTLLLSGIPTDESGQKMVIMAIINFELIDSVAQDVATASPIESVQGQSVLPDLLRAAPRQSSLKR
jgi:hypothetical protein